MDWYLDSDDKIFKNADDDIIKRELQFYSFNDFFYKRHIIKQEYKKLNTRDRRIFKMYVYSICFEDEYHKDLIWEYLNSAEYTDLRIYKEIRKEKRKKKNGLYHR